MTELKFAVIGDPIVQSLSPAMQLAAFQDLGISATFEAIHVPSSTLEAFPFHEFDGLCITVPHKLAVLPFLNEKHCEGAINIIHRKDDKLVGYNTDGMGFVNGLFDLRVENLQERKVLIIGAGGAADGIHRALLDSGFKHITTANRTLKEKGMISFREAEESLDQFGLIIQTTPVGMFPNAEQSPLSLKNVVRGTVVSDIIYNPQQTKFLAEAESRGCIIQNGVNMFVNQGALAFEIWTGQKPNKDKMKESVMKQLEEKQNVKR